MNKKLTYTIQFGVVGAALLFAFSFRHQFEMVKMTNYSFLIPVSIIILLVHFTNGLANAIWFYHFKLKLNLLEVFALSITSGLGNLITPFRGGNISNALYLKKRYHFSYESYLYTFIASYFITYWLNALMIFLILLFYTFELTKNYYLTLLFIFSFLLSPLFILKGEYGAQYLPQFVKKRVIQILNGFKELSHNHRGVWQTVGITFLNAILTMILLFIEAKLVNLSLTLGQALFITLFSSLSQLLILTPGNLGIKEAFMAYSAFLCKVSPTSLVIISMLDRVLSFIITLAIGLICSKYLLNKIEEIKYR